MKYLICAALVIGILTLGAWLYLMLAVANPMPQIESTSTQAFPVSSTTKG